MINSGSILATTNKRGSDLYTAPEISHASPGTIYSEAVDTWGLGLILYELFTGHRVFNTPAEGHQLPPRIPQLRYVKHPCKLEDTPSANASSLISAPLDHIHDDVRSQLAEFWNAVEQMKLTNEALLGEVNCVSNETRVVEINALVKALLNVDPEKRPGIKVIEHHFRANYVRSMLENDVVCSLWRKIIDISRIIGRLSSKL